VLRGQVRDAATAEPLEVAQLYLEEAETGTISAADGSFTLSGICPGDYHLSVHHLGCHPKRIFLRLRADTSLQIELAHHVELLERVTVRASRSGSTGQTQAALSRQILEREAGKNLATLLTNIAGVNIIRNGSNIGKPVIHGLTGNRVAILNNGLVQAGQQWGVDHAPEVDPFTADRIVVIKGVDNIAYGGNTLGGAVLLEPSPIGYDPHLHGAAQYIFETNGRRHTASMRLEQGGSWAQWRVIGTFKYGGDQRAPNYFLRNTGLRERSFAGLLEKETSRDWSHRLYYSYFQTDLGILRGAHVGNLSDLDRAIGAAEPFFTEDTYRASVDAPRQEVSHHLVKLSSTKKLTDSRLLKLNYGGQLNHRQEYDVRRGGRTNRPTLDMVLYSHFLEGLWVNEGPRVRTRLGVQVRYHNNDNQSGTGVLPLLPDYGLLQPGLLALFNGQWDSGWNWQFGARYDFTQLDIKAISRDLPRRFLFFDHQFQQFATSLGIDRAFSSQWSSSFNIGVTRRAPEVNELYSQGLHQGVAGIEEGDPTMQAETSFKAIWTNNCHLVEERLHLEYSVYFQRIDNFIFLEPQPETRLTIRGAFPVFLYRQTLAQLWGSDLSLRYEWSERSQIQLRHSLVRGRDMTADRPLVYMPADRVDGSLSYTFPDWGKIESPTLAWTSQYVFEQTRLIFDSENLLASQDFLAPPEAYWLNGLRASMEIHWGQRTIHCDLQIENLFNTVYRDYLNRLRYYADEPGRNIRLNVRMEF